MMLMTGIWIFCKIDIFSETISSGRTYFVIWVSNIIDPVSRINSRSWMDQLLDMMEYLGEFSRIMWDPHRITLELSSDSNVIILAS